MKTPKPAARPGRRAGAKAPRAQAPARVRPAGPAPKKAAARQFSDTGELRILYQLAGAIGHSLKLDDLLRNALQSLEGLLAIPLSAVYLTHETGSVRHFELAAFRGFSPATELQRLEYQTDQEWMVETVVRGRPWVARQSIDSLPLVMSQQGKLAGIQSWIATPLVSRGRTLGILIAASRDPHKFDLEQVQLLETIGPDLGVAIENAQLFELVQRGRNEWQATFDAVGDRIAVLDADRRVMRANRALLDALARPPAEIIGRSCTELFPETCSSDCPHLQALGGTQAEREVQSHGRSFHVTIYPGGAGQLIQIAEDVTEERAHAMKLLRAEKLSAASTVLAGIAHELNNPLTVVIAYADLLSQLEETNAFHEEIQQVLRSALRCQSIVRSVLAFSRSDEPDRTEVDVNQLVKETLPLFAYQFRIAGIRAEERLNPTLPTIAGDRTRLQQILVNVVNNSFQAMSMDRKGGWLRVQTRVRDDNVELEVQDDGPGIPPEIMPQVFEPFFTTKPPGQGTGLGLALSQQIARDHGGDIRIQSDANTGTRVTLSLPISSSIGRRGEQPIPDRESLRGLRILVVDDEPDLRQLVGTALETFGASVVLAGGGNEALAILERDTRFDVIFSDLRMPDIGGDEIVARLRARHSPLADRVLLTTGDVAAPNADAAVRTSGRPCVPKPFSVKDLVVAIRSVV